MKIIEKLKKEKLLVISCIIIYIFVFIICNFNMMAQDEYNYSHITWTSDKLESFGDIVTSQIKLYENWTGRIPALGLVQVFLYIGTIFYDLLNPIIYVIFILLICKMSNNKNTPFTVFMVALLTLASTYKFWEKYVWLSGSLNYLWPVTLMLLVMYYFNKKVVNDEEFSKPIKIFMYLIFFLCRLVT